jgi:hypothetical protein
MNEKPLLRERGFRLPGPLKYVRRKHDTLAQVAAGDSLRALSKIIRHAP